VVQHIEHLLAIVRRTHLVFGTPATTVKACRGNYANEQELILATSLKPTAKTARQKAWVAMNGREKTIFAAKVCVMIASFGWIYGNTLAPDDAPRVG
jgi:hypothetical protein